MWSRVSFAPGFALSRLFGLTAECQKAHAIKRNSKAPPCRTVLVWAFQPAMVGIWQARWGGLRAAVLVWVQPA